MFGRMGICVRVIVAAGILPAVEGGIASLPAFEFEGARAGSARSSVTVLSEPGDWMSRPTGRQECLPLQVNPPLLPSSVITCASTESAPSRAVRKHIHR
jgi:hypothetical protein